MFGNFQRGWQKNSGGSSGKKKKVPNVPAVVIRHSNNSPSKRVTPVPAPLVSPPAPPVLPSSVKPYKGPPPRLPDKFLLSILIPTLSSRAEMLSVLLEKLEYQIRQFGSSPRVEVVMDEDDGKASVGAKRNRLLSEAQGRFIVFVDDDDDVSDDYVIQICTAIETHPAVDCIGIRGIMTVAGKSPRPVVYSKRHKVPSDTGGMFLRPPQHITPIRRIIALRHKFPEVNLGEDAIWAKKLYPELKKEHFIDKVLYHYQFSPTRTATQGGLLTTVVKSDDFSIVIPSARSENLLPCVQSLLVKEPTLDPARIIVVDDGARRKTERVIKGLTWVEGKKPFCFARNVNLGIQAAPGDVILLNDDTQLETQFGITSMSYAVRGAAKIGVCSAAINGFVGNHNQKPGAPTGLRQEQRVVAFVCVYIPRTVLASVGFLDERFVGYGFDDNDYCHRVTLAGLRIMIYDGCIVRHGDTQATSTFRSKKEISRLFTQNRELYTKKWGTKA